VALHAGQNELRLKLNEDRRQRFGETGRRLALVCECGDPACSQTVILTVAEYDAIRPGPVLHESHRRSGGAPASFH
jgi:hypothetical protein